MAGPQGFEPQLPESKSGVLPLDEEPINLWCQRLESNQRHTDFQSVALPTELHWQKWPALRDSNSRPYGS